MLDTAVLEEVSCGGADGSNLPVAEGEEEILVVSPFQEFGDLLGGALGLEGELGSVCGLDGHGWEWV